MPKINDEMQHPPRKDDGWLRKNAAVVAVVIGLIGHSVALVRYATTIEKNQEITSYRQTQIENEFAEWKKSRSILPERVVRLETSVEILTMSLKDLVTEMRADRKARTHGSRQ